MKNSSVRRTIPAGHDDIRHIVHLFNRFLSGQRRLFVLALVMLVAEAATAVLQRYPLAYLVDFLKGDRPDLSKELGLSIILSPLWDTIALLTLAIIVMAMVNSLADSMSEIFLARGGRLLGYNLRTSLYAHLQRLSLAYHDHRHTGDVLTRVTGDVTAIEEFVIRSLSDIAGSFLVLVGTLVFLAVRSWQVALVAALIVPVLAVITNSFSGRIKAATKEQRAREGELASSAQEMLTSIRVVQTYSRAEHEQNRFAASSQRSMDAALQAARLQAQFSWVVKVVEALATAAVVWVGLWLRNENVLSIGTLLLFVMLIENMFKPTRRLIQEWNTIGRVYASVERIGDLLDRKPGVVDEPNAVPAPRFQGHIEFRNVSFAYEPNDPTLDAPRLALRDINFTVAPGQVLALVGHTGAGKSTIAQLLPRLYDPQAGQILIDGHDLREYTLESLRAQIGMVLQETLLFSGTVAENIAYGCPDATREQIIAAAIQAQADEFVRKLPEGYDTVIGERGASLSGGQRQRIAIARAIIRDTPILILDEPSTGLDAESSEWVLKALRELMKSKTTIIISHDLKLVRDADKVIVVKEGAIEQCGTSESLLQSGGAYANLHLTQFGSAEVAASPEPPSPPESIRHPSDSTLESEGLLPSSLPALEGAMDAEEMRERLATALWGEHARFSIVRCKPGKATFLGDLGCTLRYAVQAQEEESGELFDFWVNARLFADAGRAAAYMREWLAPLAPLVHGRPEMVRFAAPVAVIEPLQMAVSVFPIDGALPTLAAATDRQYMTRVLNEVLPDHWSVLDCRVELGRYARQHRCVLRYEATLQMPRTGEIRQQWFYGKVAQDDRGANIGPIIARLREWVLDGNGGYRFNLPRAFGFRPDLQLALWEAIPGKPQINQLLRARLRGEPDVEGLSLEEAVEASARMALALHTSEISEGLPRTITGELAALSDAAGLVRKTSLELGARLDTWLDRVAAWAAQSTALEARFSHGDFTYTQLIFDGKSSGMVDFDTICQAEPALDLGRFTAYLRLAVSKASGRRDEALADQLAERFLNTYLQGSGVDPSTADHWRERVKLYELISLLRTALHTWERLKGERLDQVLAVMEDRIACLPELNR